MLLVKGVCRRSLCFIGLPIFFLIILTIFSGYFYSTYLFNRRKDLKTLIESFRYSRSSNVTFRKEFESINLPFDLRKSIEDYLLNEHESYLIINCATGLGNRLQSIVSAFVFALVSKRRLLIHWPRTKLSGCEFDELFRSPISMSSILLNRYSEEYILDHSEHLSFHGPFDELLCHEDLSLFQSKSQFLFVSTDEYFLSVIMKNPSYSESLFSNVNEDSLFQSLIKYLFEPIKELNDQIEYYQLKHGHCHKGIHMRKDGLKQIPVNGEQTFLDCILNRTKSEYENWFLATDYPPYKDYFQKNIRSNQTKIRSLKSTGQTKQCFDVQQALIELWLLTKCEQLYLTHWSTFSWLASGISGVHPIIVQSDSCHLQRFSRPCYYELTHLKQLSCYNSNQMLTNDGCCLSEKFCQNDCLHHDSKYGAHQFYFLIVWPIFPLVKWLFKWISIICILLFLLNRIRFHWTIDTLMMIYKRIFISFIFLCLLFVDIRCLFWAKRKIV